MTDPKRRSTGLRSRRGLAIWLALLGVCGAPGGVGAAEFRWKLPLGFPVPAVPEDNPMSWEKVELGRFLFYDKRMSGNQTFSCGSCHRQELAFTDGLPVAKGSTDEAHPRGSMSLAGVAYGSTLTWANDILFALETQMLTPMFGEEPIELGLASTEQLIERRRADDRYGRFFAEAFPAEADPVTLDNVTKAVASFERTLLSGNSSFDRYFFGIDDDIDPAVIRGRDLFFNDAFPFQCHHCHGTFNFDFSIFRDGDVEPEIGFFNNALYNIDGAGSYPPGNRGIFERTGVPTDMGRFKAPTLRNIAVTAPYMHDGSIATLDEVLDHYAAGGRTITEGPFAGDGSQNPYKDQFISEQGFNMSEQQRHDLLAFLESLTDEEFLTNPKLADPFELAVCSGDCNHDGEVALNEIVANVNVALRAEPLATCWPGDDDEDGNVDIAELTRAVRSSLQGCP